MKKLCAVLIVIAICVVGFGFYRGWFALSSPSPTEGSNEVNVNLATDTDKMKEDAQTVKDKAAELTGNVTEGSSEPADRPTDAVQSNQVPPDDGQPQRVEPTAVQSDGNLRTHTQARSRVIGLATPDLRPISQWRTTMLWTILIVILILMLLGALPTWGHSRSWGYAPSGGLGLIALILVVLLLTGRV